MNQVMDVLMKRKSVRAYEERAISPEVRAEILKATLRAPTAGNLMLYSILDVTDQSMKDKLAVTCDDQPFIARAITSFPQAWRNSVKRETYVCRSLRRLIYSSPAVPR